MTATTATVRINGLPYLVPGDDLRGPITHREPCGAREPEAWGGARCTLAPHRADVLHIARNSLSGRLVAVWAGYLADEPREHALAADLPAPVGA